MKDLHISHLDQVCPQAFYVNTWVSEIHKEIEREPDKGDVFFLSLAYFNTYDNEARCYETQQAALEASLELGPMRLEDRPDIAQAFPVYLRVRKSRVISTGIMPLLETLEWLNGTLERQQKTMVLRFADKQCQDLAWYSVAGPWQADESEEDPEVQDWIEGVMEAVMMERRR